MRLGQVFWNRYKNICCTCVFNKLSHAYSNVTPFRGYQKFLQLNINNTSYLVRGVIYKLPYSTSNDSKRNELSEKAKLIQAKKKKEIKVFITLIGTDGNISVTTVEDATKLALRRNLRLVKEMDLDPKSGRAVYKLMTESQYLKGDMDGEESKSKKTKDKFVKGEKVVSLSSTTAEHDILTKAKMMQKWLDKKFEVRVVISGDPKNGENVFNTVEKEIGDSGRIVQKRSKGQDIRFQILPPKKTESPKKTKPPKKAEETETVKEEM